MRLLTALSFLSIGSLLVVANTTPTNTQPTPRSPAPPAAPTPPRPSATATPSSSPSVPPSRGAAVPPSTSPTLDLKGIDDNLVAAKRTKAFLAKLGYDAEFPTKDPSDGIWIKDMGVGFTIRAFANDAGLDRLIISCGTPGLGPANLRSKVALSALNDLNSTFNTCTFSLTPEGDLVFTFHLGFSDTLDGQLFREQMLHIQTFVSHFLTTDDPDAAKPRDLLVK